MTQLLGKRIQCLLKILNIELQYNSANPLLGIYSEKAKAGTWIDICIPAFILPLFTITKRWKQPKNPLTDGLKRNVVQNTVEYYSVLIKVENYDTLSQLIGEDPNAGKDRVGRESNRGWDGWMASTTQWTWVWTNSGRWWRTGKLDVLQSMVLHRWTRLSD